MAWIVALEVMVKGILRRKKEKAALSQGGFFR
jgi:hypothetical protein